ncbi:PTS sugar transporter subunit IIA [Kibdelosporangium aridum]|uniref:PTS sugar transporter subunit IIA n=1 Tax=Kibdelosporangium aridum TaxID=2030 RepID=UPI0028A1D37A|nr:PTS sugar transporter subunit IIA [Kibdelosporangium aridum]
MTRGGASRALRFLPEPRAIRLSRRARDRADAVEQVGRTLIDVGAVAEEYLCVMHRREASGSTYIGGGVAIPHATDEFVSMCIVRRSRWCSSPMELSGTGRMCGCAWALWPWTTSMSVSWHCWLGCWSCRAGRTSAHGTGRAFPYPDPAVDGEHQAVTTPHQAQWALDVNSVTAVTETAATRLVSEGWGMGEAPRTSGAPIARRVISASTIRRCGNPWSDGGRGPRDRLRER